MSSIKVGIVGYGLAAKNFHIPFLAAIPDYEIVAVLQRAAAPEDPKTLPSGVHCTVDFPAVKHYRSAEAFFADPEILLIVVATHVDTHAMFAEKAIHAGKHVIVDKPFARSSEEADRVIRLANQKGTIITCFQNRRWDGGFQTLRKLLDQNALGEIKEAEIHYDFESPSWLVRMTEKEYIPGVGMIFHLGSHSIDQALVLFGLPVSVTGFFRAQRAIDSEVEDSFTIILQYTGSQKDLLVTVKTSVTTPMAQQLKLLVRGTAGSFMKFQQRSTCPQEEDIGAGKSPLDSMFGVEEEGLHGLLTTYEEFDNTVQRLDPQTKMYVGRYPTITGRWLGLYENLAEAIQGKAELSVRASESRDVLRVIELARKSHDQGVTVAWT